MFPGYELLSLIDKSTIGRIYQIGLEGELYYIGAPVIGDHFGPARYRDTVKLRSSPDELAEHLRSLGADHLLIDLLRYPNGFNIDADDPLFAKYFELVRETPRAALYRIRNSVNYT
jgi:hypothetical protein